MNFIFIYIFKEKNLWTNFFKEKRENEEKKTIVSCTIFKLIGYVFFWNDKCQCYIVGQGWILELFITPLPHSIIKEKLVQPHAFKTFDVRKKSKY